MPTKQTISHFKFPPIYQRLKTQYYCGVAFTSGSGNQDC